MTATDPKETFAIRNPLTDTKRLLGHPTPMMTIAMALILAVMMAMFLSYTGWVLGAKPIDEIELYELENTPAPEYARSFSVNHGWAIYYRDDVPSKHPTKRNLIIATFFGLYGVLLALVFVSRRNAKRKGISLQRAA